RTARRVFSGRPGPPLPARPQRPPPRTRPPHLPRFPNRPRARSAAMLERLPFWGQVVLMFALALGCVGIAYYLWPNLKQKGEEIATLRTELEDMNAKILEGQASERHLAQL